MLLNAPEDILRAALGAREVMPFLTKYDDLMTRVKLIHEDTLAIMNDIPSGPDRTDYEKCVITMMMNVSEAVLGNSLSGHPNTWPLMNNTPATVGRAYQAEVIRLISLPVLELSDLLETINHIYFSTLNLKPLNDLYLSDEEMTIEQAKQIQLYLTQQAIALVTRFRMGHDKEEEVDND